MKGDIIDTEIIKIIRVIFLSNKFENLDEKNYCVRKYKLSKMSLPPPQKKIEFLNKPSITREDTGSRQFC